jgi:hypothetical protein
MALVDSATITVLTSILKTKTIRELFKTIANSRIAERSALEKADPGADEALGVLEKADLIGAASDGKKFYVTAKGLKVARDLEQIPFA